jgi:hypothetical protein
MSLQSLAIDIVNTLPSNSTMDSLMDGEFILFNSPQTTKPLVCVKASAVDKIHIRVKCPFCWTSKNGLSSGFTTRGVKKRGAVRDEHKHGSRGDLSIRSEDRSGHCIESPYDKYMSGYVVFITESTRGATQLAETSAGNKQ